METRKWMDAWEPSILCIFSTSKELTGMQGELLQRWPWMGGCCQHYQPYWEGMQSHFCGKESLLETPLPVETGQKMQSFEPLTTSC